MSDPSMWTTNSAAHEDAGHLHSEDDLMFAWGLSMSQDAGGVKRNPRTTTVSTETVPLHLSHPALPTATPGHILTPGGGDCGPLSAGQRANTNSFCTTLASNSEPPGRYKFM